MSMPLSLTSWSLPSCTLQEAADISRALGIGALDLGLFYRSALDKGLILSDPQAAAAPLEQLGVALPNYYHLFGDGLAGQNLALPGTLENNLPDLRQVLTFADAAGIRTVFILPGVVNPGQSRGDAFKVSAASLSAMVELASEFNATLCIEPHVHSFAESPQIVGELIEATGIKLALDYSHFVCLGYRQDEIDPLAAACCTCASETGENGRTANQVSAGHPEFPGHVRHASRCRLSGNAGN